MSEQEQSAVSFGSGDHLKVGMMPFAIRRSFCLVMAFGLAIGSVAVETPTRSLTAVAASSGFPPVSVFVGYADNLRPNPFFPSPWAGSTNTNFVGTGPTYDAGAIRIDNPASADVPVGDVSVDIGSSHFDLWGSPTIPANGTLILTQTSGNQNFDTSDYPVITCTPDGIIPVVHVTINGITTSYSDTRQVLNTGGFDLATCPAGSNNNESHQWQQVGGGPSPSETKGGSNPSEHQTLCNRAGPVNCVTGEFWHSFVDLEIPGRGLPLAFARTYSSQSAPQDGRLGFGWTDNYNLFLTTEAGSGNVTVSQENGSTVTFTPTPSGYQAPSRVLASLAKSADGTTFTFTRHAQTRFLFDASSGRLQQITDLNSYSSILAYNTIGQLVAVTDPAGRKITFAYTGTHLTSAADPLGRTVRFAYDSNGNLSAATDVSAGVTSFTYDQNHVMLSMTDPNGGVTSNTYDSSGRVISQSDPLHRVTAFSYGAGSTTITDPNGDVSIEQYENDELVSLTQAAGTSLARTWSFTYDQATLGVTSITDPKGNSYTNTWDPNGNLMSSTDSLGRTVRFTYDAFNDMTSVTDPAGVAISYTYDANGNLLTASRPLTGSGLTVSIAYSYDPLHAGDVTAATDQMGKTWQFGYDPVTGDQTRVTDPVGNTDTFAYDAAGQLASAVSPKGNVAGANPAAYTTRFTVDSFGSVTSIANPLGQKTQVQWDANRNMVKVIDANGNPTSYTYDPGNQITGLTRADGSVSQYTYDGNGNVTAQIDPLGHATTYAYDALNRLTAVTDPLGRTTSLAFDPVDNLVARTDPNGLTTSYGYDVGHELTGITYGDGKTPNVSFTYDGLGRRTQMTDGSGSSSYAWDSFGHLVQSVNGAGRTVKYGYNARGDLTTITYPDGSTVQRSYDDVARLTGVSDWLGHQSTFSYDANGNVVGLTYPNGVKEALSYDSADQLSGLGFSGPMGQITFTYGRDATGQVTSENVVGEPPSGPVSYTYDPASRVTGANYGFTQQSFQYDGADHVVKATLGGTTSTFAYDKADQLLSMTTTNGTKTLQQLHFTYDANGNRVQQTDQAGKTTSLTYDQANRLVNYAGIAQYGYNGDGLNTGKTVGGAAQPFTWDLADGAPVMVQDGTTRYVTGLDGLPLEQVAADGTIHYYHQDQLGSTRALTNASGQVDAAYAYDPYGNTVSTGNVANPFQYGGEYTNGESGMQYLRARHYDPKTAQFISRDPMAASGAQAYTYSADDPLNLDDPSGLGSSASGPGGSSASGVCAAISLVTGIGTALGIASDIAGGAQKSASALGRALSKGSPAARSMAGKWLPKVGRFAKNPFFRGLRYAGRALVVVGAVLTFTNALSEGDSVGRAAARTAGAVVGGYVGASLGAAACGAIAAASAGIGALSCWILIPAGGYLGSYFGEQLGGYLYDHAPAVVSAVGNFASSVRSSVSGAAHAVSSIFHSAHSLVPWLP